MFSRHGGKKIIKQKIRWFFIQKLEANELKYYLLKEEPNRSITFHFGVFSGWFLGYKIYATSSRFVVVLLRDCENTRNSGRHLSMKNKQQALRCLAFAPKIWGKKYTQKVQVPGKNAIIQASSSTLLVVVLISRIATIFWSKLTSKIPSQSFYSGREKRNWQHLWTETKNTGHPSCSWSKIQKKKIPFSWKKIGIRSPSFSSSNQQKGKADVLYQPHSSDCRCEK